MARHSLVDSGQFVTFIAALHGNPYDGHTLKDTIAGVKAITGLEPERIFADKGYRGHNYHQLMRVYRSGQRRGVIPAHEMNDSCCTAAIPGIAKA